MDRKEGGGEGGNFKCRDGTWLRDELLISYVKEGNSRAHFTNPIVVHVSLPFALG